MDWAKATSVKDDPQFGALLDTIFARLRDEFRDETLNGSAVLELVSTQLHILTGGQMMDFMERMRGAFPRVLTHKMIANWIGSHFARIKGKRQLPRLSSTIPGTEQFKAGSLTWGDIEKALLRGESGLPGNECLAEITYRYFGSNCECRQTLDPTKVHVSDGPTPTLIDYHIRNAGIFPAPCDEPIPYTDLTWGMLQQTILKFRNSMRWELPDNETHLAIIYYYLGENLIELISQWVAANGTLPSAGSGVIPNTGGLTWADAEKVVRQENVGSLKSSREYNDQLKWTDGKIKELSDSENLRTYWTKHNIYKWVRRWIRATGSPPTLDSGVIPESGGVCWSEIDDDIRIPHRKAELNVIPRTVLEELGKASVPYAYDLLSAHLGPNILELLYDHKLGLDSRLHHPQGDVALNSMPIPRVLRGILLDRQSISKYEIRVSRRFRNEPREIPGKWLASRLETTSSNAKL